MRIQCTLLMGLTLAIRAFPQSPDADSTRVYHMREVTVTATRSPIPVDEAPSRVQILSQKEIRAAMGTTLSDLLRQTSANFVRTYGGDASLSTMSVRGGASEHLLVLLNGTRFTSFQNGLADLNLLPLSGIERVELVSGGSSALYGPDAVSGVLNITSKAPTGEFHLRGEGSVGSFGRSSYRMEAEGALGAVQLLGGYSMDRGRDDYAFPAPEGSSGSVHREGSDFVREEMHAHGGVAIGDFMRAQLSAQDVRAERGSPGPYSPGSTPDARLSDHDDVLTLTLASRSASSLTWELITSYHYNFETYRDPDEFFPYEAEYRNVAGTVSPVVRWLPGASHTLTIGGEFTEGRLEGSDFDSRIVRVQRGLFASYHGNFDADAGLLDRISPIATVRYDAVSDVGGSFTPKVGVNIRLGGDGNVHLRSSAGRSFRAPSFNDLYFRYLGNPDLKPERSSTFDAGASAEARLLGRHELGVNYFLVRTEERILFDPVLYIPINIGTSRSSGIEVDYRFTTFDEGLSLSAGYCFTSAVKLNADSAGDASVGNQLPYVPMNVFTAQIRFSADAWGGGMTYNLVGDRYTSVANVDRLDAYSLIGCTLEYRILFASLRTQLKGEIENVFNVAYETYKSYPMPGRSYRLTLGIEY